MKIQKSFEVEDKALYIVSTPIGNLGDMTFRALEILNEVDLILAEDTRVTSKLKSHFHISTPLESYQKFNEKEKLDEVIELLLSGKSIALVSDAGTPLMSDPGFLLVKAAIKNEIPVIPIPGASSILAGLVISGILPQPFTFLGFLPRKKGELRESIEDFIGRKESLVIFESPLRVKKLLHDLYEILGQRNVVLARELTKKFETIYRGKLPEMLSFQFEERGEYVIIVEGEFKREEVILDIVS